MLRFIYSVSFILFVSSAFAQSTSVAPTTSGAGAGKAFNPDISTNFLGLYERSSALPNDSTQVPHNGLSLQEAELQLFSDVDPYLKASALLSISQNAGTNDFGISPEEVFVETISLPAVTLRVGKFKMALGRHNQLHTHAFPLIDAPLIHQILLGSEGLNEVGGSASILLPIDWYSEVIVQGFRPGNSSLYGSPNSDDLGSLAHLKNLWDLNDDLTMELGLSGTSAKNRFGQTSSAYGSDLTFKWRPSIGGKYHALIWSTEYLDGYIPGLTDPITNVSTPNLGGIASWIQYQFDERWWLEGRYEYVGLPYSVINQTQNKQSALVGFFPSEFSGFRLQYDRIVSYAKANPDNAVSFQYNVTIGAHPAHAY